MGEDQFGFDFWILHIKSYNSSCCVSSSQWISRSIYFTKLKIEIFQSVHIDYRQVRSGAFLRERKRRWVKSELFCSNLTNLIIVILLHLSVSLRLFFSLILYYYCWFIRPWQHCPNVGPTFFYSTETQKSYQIIFHNASKQTERYSRLVIQQSVCIGTLCWAH